MDYLKIQLQQQLEDRFSKTLLDKKLTVFTQDSLLFVEKVNLGISLVNNWLKGSYYSSKQARLADVDILELPQLVTKILRATLYCRTDTPFNAVVGMCANYLGWDDKPNAIRTTAEILAVLCDTNAFDINKVSRESSLTLVSKIDIGELEDNMVLVQYMPPMIIKPEELTSNSDTGYLNHKGSLILGGNYNHHEGNICLDVLDIQNSVQLKLDVEFLDTVAETPKHPCETKEQEKNWDTFKKESADIYRLIIRAGNTCYLTHKVDKRGRMYAQGYHLTTQGSAYKKAMLELATPEMVEGV